jgi:hypothetical protein
MIDGEFLARLVGNAIVRATCIEAGERVVGTDDGIACHALTRAVERLRSRAEKAEAELAEQRENTAARVDRLADEWRVETGRLQAEVARLRARVSVEAEDVERVGLTQAHVEAWLLANGWRKTKREYSDGTTNWIRGDGGYSVLACSDADVIAHVAQTAALIHERPGLTILDEMAAMLIATIPQAPARES